MIPHKFNNILYLADSNGTGFYRALQATDQIWALGPGTGINNSVLFRPVGDANYYKNLNSVMIQRWIDENNLRLMNDFINPLAHQYNFWTIYNIDDAMMGTDICKFNRGRRAFLGKERQDNIRKMLGMSDFVLTTTDYIKEYYHRTYGVPLENIICIPNYLPKWWSGELYDPERKIAQFKENKNKKLRIGVVSSLSHFNIEHVRETPDGKVVYTDKDEKTGKEKYVTEDEIEISKEEYDKLPEVKDDLDLILDTIIRTVDRYQWVFFGYAPPKLKEYIDKKKIEVRGGVPITDYPNELKNLRLDAIVAPIIDNEFNRCKSNIKFLEACAVGVPLYASRVDPTYVKYMPDHQLFKDSQDLYDKLDKLSTSSVNRFISLIEEQWKFINSPHHECGWNSPNWWMENNMKPWMDLFRMKHRAAEISLNVFMKREEARKEREKAEKDKIMFQNDNGVQILR